MTHRQQYRRLAGGGASGGDYSGVGDAVGLATATSRSWERGSGRGRGGYLSMRRSATSPPTSSGRAGNATTAAPFASTIGNNGCSGEGSNPAPAAPSSPRAYYRRPETAAIPPIGDDVPAPTAVAMGRRAVSMYPPARRYQPSSPSRQHQSQHSQSAPSTLLTKCRSSLLMSRGERGGASPPSSSSSSPPPSSALQVHEAATMPAVPPLACPKGGDGNCHTGSPISQHQPHRSAANPALACKSALASSSRSHPSLRDRLRRLSRSQKKDLLVRGPSLSGALLPTRTLTKSGSGGGGGGGPRNRSWGGSTGLRRGGGGDSSTTAAVCQKNANAAKADASTATVYYAGLENGKVPEDDRHDKDEGVNEEAKNGEGEACAAPARQSMIVDHPMSLYAPGEKLTSTSRAGSDPFVIVGTPYKTNDVKLHIYDLIAHDTLMQLPWGCVCEIGKCFNEVNSALHELGTGAYHVGVEVNGIEYAYGATSTAGRTGVFSSIPKHSPGYQYRTTINFGKRPLLKKTWIEVSSPPRSGTTNPASTAATGTTFLQKVEYVDGRQVIKEMASEYMGIDYDILRRNCCTFARDACLRLGILETEIPSWFRNLAESGAEAQDLAQAAVLPIAKVLSNEYSYAEEKTSEPDPDKLADREQGDSGFEVVAQRSDLLVVFPPMKGGATNITPELHHRLGFARQTALVQ